MAERFAAWDLQAKGHDVVFPRLANNAGWDLLIDGRPFQVKCVTNPSEVWKHLRTYPNIPVLVNAEMAGEFAGVGNVHVLATLKETTVREATKDTIRHGAGFTRFEIPWVSLMIMSGTALTKVVLQKTDLAAAFSTVIVDSTSRSFLGLLGRHATACAGSMLFGPAGWVIGQQIGQIAGARLGKPVADRIKQLFVQDEAFKVYEGISNVLVAAANEIDPKREAKGQQEEMLSSLMPSAKANDQVMGRVREEFQESVRYLKNKWQEMQSCARDPRSQFKSPINGVEETCILTTQAGIHPQAVQMQWRQVSDALADLEREKRRFGVT